MDSVIQHGSVSEMLFPRPDAHHSGFSVMVTQAYECDEKVPASHCRRIGKSRFPVSRIFPQ